MSSQAAVQISRGALMVMSAGAGSLYLYVNGHTPAGLVPSDIARVALGLAPLGTAGAAGGAGTAGAPGAGPQQDSMLRPLADQLTELSNEVARLRLQAMYGGGSGGYVFSSQGWGFSWSTIATAGGVGVLFLYMRGYSFGDFMYVTKKALEVAVDALEQSIDTLGTALETAKRELSYKMGLIENKIDDTKSALENKISSEVGDVKRDLEAVGNDIKGISRNQDRVHGMVQSIETQIDTIESKMENANSALTTANRGIYLLCNVVAENMAGPKGGNGPGRGRSLTSLYDELMSFTRGSMSAFGGSGGAAGAAPPADRARAWPQAAPVPAPALPSPDETVQMLTTRASVAEAVPVPAPALAPVPAPAPAPAHAVAHSQPAAAPAPAPGASSTIRRPASLAAQHASASSRSLVEDVLGGTGSFIFRSTSAPDAAYPNAGGSAPSSTLTN